MLSSRKLGRCGINYSLPPILSDNPLASGATIYKGRPAEFTGAGGFRHRYQMANGTFTKYVTLMCCSAVCRARIAVRLYRYQTFRLHVNMAIDRPRIW